MAYMPSFIKKHWDIIKHKLINEIQQIFSQNSIPMSWGNTLLCIIPKIENAHQVAHFRPIGLCNTYYKILTKILVNRKPILPCIISPFQGAFTPQRHCSDLFLIAQETIHSMNSSKCKDD